MRTIVKQGKFWLPDYDTHFASWSDYQREIYDLALPHVRGRTQAVDIGAHVGIWSRRFAADFQTVFAFEPQRDNQLCFLRNARGCTFLCGVALGEQPGHGFLTNPNEKNSGAWELRRNAVTGDKADMGDGLPKVEILTLDSFNLAPDIIKIDTQGSEEAIIKGARGTISKHRPVVICEASDNLEALGALFADLGGRSVGQIRKDVVVIFDA